MTVPHGMARPARLPASLRCSIDLGPEVTIGEIARQSNALASLWRYTVITLGIAAARARVERDYGKTRIEVVDGGAALSFEVLSTGLRFHHGLRPAENDQTVEASPLLIRSMSLASPWDLALTTFAQTSGPVMYGMAALLSLERLVKMIRELQTHRQDMLDRQLQRDLLRRSSAVPTLAGDDIVPAAELAAAEQAVEQLAQHRILRVEIVEEASRPQ